MQKVTRWQCLVEGMRETLAVRWLVPVHLAMGCALVLFMSMLLGSFDTAMLWGIAIMLANIPAMGLYQGACRWIIATGRRT